MRLRLLYHGHCFDGVASAAVFTRFYLSRVRPGSDVSYAPLLHTAGALFDEAMFDGDENAIVDFKYSPSERLTWWFDHHQSAFLSAEDEAHFHADASGRKFWDADSKSCTEFIARVADEKFGFRDESLGTLVHWAHVIDGAFYESAAQPVELREPALQLMQVIENVDDEFIEWVIRELPARTKRSPRARRCSGASGPCSRATSRRSTPSAARPSTSAAPSPSTSWTRGSKASTSSSPTTSAPRRPTRWQSRAAATAPKSRSARTPSARGPGGTTSPPSASA